MKICLLKKENILQLIFNVLILSTKTRFLQRFAKQETWISTVLKEIPNLTIQIICVNKLL